ncbi:MAG: hypothetical protein H6506_00605 [Calditrichaeota bacterium]|nr:hypothetical protein [Calditrichota bacterium]MCB9391137.1 hypothetical protein [Calditrichota bacterium]
MILIFFLLFGVVQAQAGGSIFGAQPTGDPQQSGGVRSVGLGGAGLAIWDSLGIHADNAAQMGGITGTMLRAGMYTGLYTVSGNSQNDTDSEFGWQSFRLYLNLHPRYRTALGVDPIRKSDVRTIGLDTLFFDTAEGMVAEPFERRTSWQGSGLDIRWDHAFVLSNRIVLGATAGFLTEHMELISDLDFPDTDASNDARDASFRSVQRFSGFWGGVSFLLKPVDRWTLGGFWRSRASSDFAYERAVNHGGDAILLEPTGHRPGAFGAGVGYKWDRMWTAYADYRQQNWTVSDYGPMFSESGLRDVDATALLLGVERQGGTRLTDEGFDRWDYRAGLAYRLQPWQISGSSGDVVETALSLGVSLPLAQQAGKLHLALEGGQRVPEDSDSSENFVRFYMQLDMHERWFQRERRTLRK